MSTASASEAVYVKGVDGLKEVLKLEFRVPNGKKADIVGLFNAESYKYPNGYAYLEFHPDSLDSEPLTPGQQWVADGYIHSGGYPTITGQAFLKNVGPGNHTLYAAMSSTGGDTYVADRSLILFANVR